MSASAAVAAAAAGEPVPQHITTLVAAAAHAGRPLVSLEFFPPKTAQGMRNLHARIARMRAQLAPAWIQLTWGAGGSTRESSMELAAAVQADAHAERGNACLHLTCTNVEKESLDETLDVSARER